MSTGEPIRLSPDVHPAVAPLIDIVKLISVSWETPDICVPSDIVRKTYLTILSLTMTAILAVAIQDHLPWSDFSVALEEALCQPHPS